KVEGQALMPILENAPLPRVQRLFAEFCRHFAALHRLEWQQYFMAEFDIQDPYAFIDRSLAYLRRWTEHYGVADFGVLEAWFQAGREQAKCERYGLCHNDFHPMNVLVNEQEQMVVIDWANIEIGDPR